MSLNIGGHLREWTSPVVMGIINVTSDSFYPGSRTEVDDVCARAEQMLASGADMIDLGGQSTRPGASDPGVDAELKVVLPAVEALRSRFPEVVISVDTYRAEVARRSVEAGADIINDISGGTLDPDMFETVAELKVPYVLTHMRGTPATMQSLTDYDDVVADVLEFLAGRADILHQLGVCDVIIDPGFGFAKTVDQCYQILRYLEMFTKIGPVLAGMSRKSMVTRELNVTPEQALNGTIAVNMVALLNGAAILRVHDVAAARETVTVYDAYMRNAPAISHVITTTDYLRSTIGLTPDELANGMGDRNVEVY